MYVECSPAVKIKERLEQGRYSGGLQVLIQLDIKQLVKLIPGMICKYEIWLRIDQTTLHSDKDLYICGVYLSHPDSNYATKNPFKLMEKDFSDFSAKGNLLMISDFNARTSNVHVSLFDCNGDDRMIVDHTIGNSESEKRFILYTGTNTYGKSC